MPHTLQHTQQMLYATMTTLSITWNGYGTRSFLSGVYVVDITTNVSGELWCKNCDVCDEKNSHHMDTIRWYTLTHLLGTNTTKISFDESRPHIMHIDPHTHIWTRTYGVALNYQCSKVFWFQFLSDLVVGTWHALCTNFKNLDQFNFFSRFVSAKLWTFANFHRSILHAMLRCDAVKLFVIQLMPKTKRAHSGIG